MEEMMNIREVYKVLGVSPASVIDLERVMNLAEKPHQNADSSVNSVPYRSPFSGLASDS